MEESRKDKQFQSKGCRFGCISANSENWERNWGAQHRQCYDMNTIYLLCNMFDEKTICRTKRMLENRSTASSGQVWTSLQMLTIRWSNFLFSAKNRIDYERRKKEREKRKANACVTRTRIGKSARFLGEAQRKEKKLLHTIHVTCDSANLQSAFQFFNFSWFAPHVMRTLRVQRMKANECVIRKSNQFKLASERKNENDTNSGLWHI